LIGELFGIADEGSVAEVAIFQGSAISVLLAGAIYLVAGALLVLALVSNRTRIPVITINVVSHKKTAAGFVAGIVGTGIVIVAEDLAADALAGHAVVGHGTGIPVDAFAFVEGQMLAAVGSETGIFGAEVVVVAGAFVGFSVAIVVGSVAGFFSGHSCIAVGETFLTANALAFT
jgi:hypothetical protein